MEERTELTGSKVLITVATMAAALMALLDISIVNVALSDIRASFGTPLDQIAWVSTGYMMANVVIIPMTGWFQARFGFRRYFAISILIFTAASALCAFAWNLPSLVLFRVLQGCGGGAIIPTAQGILFARYPRSQQNMAGALFGLGAVTGPLLGPTIGGYLIDVANWHWIFLINVPVGLFAAFMAWRNIEQPEFEPSRAPIDRTGLVLLIVGMASLQYTLEEGNRDSWFESPTICVTATLAALGLITFVVHQLESKNPIVDLRVFGSRTYTAATGLNFLIGTVLFGGSFLFSLYAGTVMRYTALDIGLLFLQSNWIQILLMPLIGRFGGKVDGRYLVAFGIAGLCVSLTMNAHLTQLADTSAMIRPLFVRAVALSCVFVPLSVMALGDLPPKQRGAGTGMFNLTRELGGSIGTAWMSTALDRASHRYVSYMGAHVTATAPTAQEQIGMIRRGVMATMPSPELSTYAVLDSRVHGQALIRAFSDGYVSLTLLFVMSFVLIAMLRRAQPGMAAAGAH